MVKVTMVVVIIVKVTIVEANKVAMVDQHGLGHHGQVIGKKDFW